MPIELNDTAPTEPARVKRHKPKRGLGSAVTRRRRLQAEALDNDVANARERAREAARQEMARIINRQKEDGSLANTRWQQNLLRSVVGNQTAVLRAYGHKQSVQCDLNLNAQNVVAWTDFQRINVTWPECLMPDRLNTMAVLDTTAQMKGVMQHEMGHVRFTTPWPTVCADAPIPAKYVAVAGLIQKCWNMLEDERMECLVVESVPRIANYFGTMVANVVLGGDKVELPIEQTWLMLAGRTYLPLNVLQISATTFDAFCAQQGVKDGARRWEKLVNNYKAATSTKQIMEAVCEAYDFIQEVRATLPEIKHVDPRGDGADPKDTGRKQGSILDMFDEKPKPPKKSKGKGDGQPGPSQPGPSQPAPGKGEKDGDEGEGKGKGDKDGEGEDEGDEEGDEPGKGQSDTGDGSETPTQEQTLRDALSEMTDQFKSTMRGDKDVQSMARDANLKADHDGLQEYDGRNAQEMSPELQERARHTSLGIQSALNSFVTTSSPIWQTRKEMGVIDALHYRTKNPGDRDFRRHLEDKGNIGLDVHVSMLCDVSGSMNGAPMQALSEALFATGLACNALGIGATYTLWSSPGQDWRVWQDGNPTPTLWPSMGGTDPTVALDDLDTHNKEEAANHLVIIFTDGAWSGSFPSLQRWAASGRTFVLVRYGRYDGEMQKDMGADSHIGISDVADLPGQLTKSLIDVLSDGGGW